MDYRLGDMMGSLYRGRGGPRGAAAVPRGLPGLVHRGKEGCAGPPGADPVCGDPACDGYAMGNTLRNGESTRRMRKQAQEMKREGDLTRIETLLADDRGNQVLHTLTWQEGDRFVRTFCEYRNGGDAPRTLLLLSSFSLEQISPYLPGDGAGQAAGAPPAVPLEPGGPPADPDAGGAAARALLGAWAPSGASASGQVGSMPVNHYFPFLAVEDVENHVFWGAQIAHPASWQMEIYRRDENLAVSGGLADREFGHWKKSVAPGERFRTPEAILSSRLPIES